jgi:hypothetical protein
VSNVTVHAGGFFTSIGGQTRSYCAALDATTGQATAWTSGANGAVSALAVSNGAVYAGGAFTSMRGLPQAYIARLYAAPAAPPSVTVLAPDGGEGVNIGTVWRLFWTASAPAPGIQSVDLYLSRNGAMGPWELLAAGAANTGHYDWTVNAPASAGSCYLWVDARDYRGQIGSDITDAGFTIGSGLVGVGEPAAGATFELGPAAPNPVRWRSVLSYTVPRRSQVQLTLLDVQGRVVSRVFDGNREAGRYAVPLDAAGLAPGLYFVRLQARGRRSAPAHGRDPVRLRSCRVG